MSRNTFSPRRASSLALSTRISSAYWNLAGADRTVQVWNVVSGKRLSTYHGYSSLSDVVAAVAWSLDGKHIASGSTDKTVQLWEAASAQHLYTYKRHTGTVFALAWSPVAPHIASGSADDTVRIWQTS